ncbi:hypothetical protein [Streptomyces geranii]|uniref:hypothetical protein n=1 Tax=Streptomyces geranii TaxID=2058923 RepID=UPI0013008E68|nr:hypothetical protein [Streptomyces geranii]
MLYLLDPVRIDIVGPYLALLGACRLHLAELRGVFGGLLAGCGGHADARYSGTQEETDRVWQLLERLAPVAGPGDPRPLLPAPRKQYLDLPTMRRL